MGRGGRGDGRPTPRPRRSRGDKRLERPFRLAAALLLAVSLLVGGAPEHVGSAAAADDDFADAQPGVVLVQMRAGFSVQSSADNAHARVGSPVGLTSFRELKVEVGTERQSLAALRADRRVAVAVPNHRVRISYTPNDADLGRQYALSVVRAPSAWDVATGAGVTIAIVDTGVDLGHPDLAANLVPGCNMIALRESPGGGCGSAQDDNGHGTHVAGIAAAVANNGIGVAGIAHGARLMPIKVLDENGVGYTSDVAAGLSRAVSRGARVLNVSLSGGHSPVLESAVRTSQNLGALVVSAAGNCGPADASYPTPTCSSLNVVAYPAAYAGVVAVASSTAQDERSSFSTQGSYVTVAAPGSSIYSTGLRSLGGDYRTYSGTSMATPAVSALAALIWSAHPTLTADQVRQAVVNSALKVGSTTYVGGRNNAFGYGRVDAVAALAAAAPSPTPTSTPTRTPTPTRTATPARTPTPTPDPGGQSVAPVLSPIDQPQLPSLGFRVVVPVAVLARQP